MGITEKGLWLLILTIIGFFLGKANIPQGTEKIKQMPVVTQNK
jgi:hypothetical protein